MKISEMTNDQAADVMVRIAEPFGVLCEDEALMDMINEYVAGQSKPFIQTIGKIIPKLVAYLLKSHKGDLYEIIGALAFKPKADVGKMNFVETVKFVQDSYDEVLLNFFSSSLKKAKREGTI